MNYLEACGILGASPNDDLKTIKNHYKSKIRFYHPDNYQDNKEKIEYAEEMTKKLNEAWEYIQQNYDNPTKMDSDTSYNDQPTEEIVVHTYVSIEFKIFLIALAVIAIAAIFFCITEGVNLWLDEKREEREYSQYIDSLSEDDRMAFETYNFTTVEGGYSISAINTSISGSVTIPEEFDGIPIVAIGDGAFRDCIELAEVIMPNSILYVGAESFEGCTSLSNVKFSDSLKEISNYAFHDCSALQAVQLPNCIEKIGSKAF